MATFCKTIVQYHIQHIDIDIVTYRTVSSPQGSCVLPFYSHIHLAPHCFLLLIFPYPWQPLLCSVLLKFYTNGMIQYVPYWDWLFNSAKFPGDSPRLLHMSTVRSFLLLTSMLWYGYTTACLTIHIIWLTRTYFSLVMAESQKSMPNSTSILQADWPKQVSWSSQSQRVRKYTLSLQVEGKGGDIHLSIICHLSFLFSAFFTSRPPSFRSLPHVFPSILKYQSTINLQMMNIYMTGSSPIS